MPDLDDDHSRPMQQVEALVHELERAPDRPIRERAQQLLRAVLDLHKAGLSRMLDVIRRTSDSESIVRELAADDLVAALLLLHDLHPIPLDLRVQRTMDAVQERAAKHGAGVALVANRDGCAVIRISAATGCGSSAATVRQMVEEALAAEAPDLARLEFEVAEPPPAQAFVPLQRLKSDRVPTSSQPA